MTGPISTVFTPTFADLPDDALVQIMDKIDHPSPHPDFHLKGGGLATFGLSQKRVYRIFRDFLGPRDAEGCPQSERGRDWERKMAKSFLRRDGSFEGLVCNWQENENGELVNKQSSWLKNDPQTQIEAIRYGQLPWDNWRDLDPTLKTDPEFVLKELLSNRLTIEDLRRFSSGAELRSLFGLAAGERITLQNLSTMQTPQCKIASLYTLERLQQDSVQLLLPGNFPPPRPRPDAFHVMYEGIFSELLTRPDFDFSKQFLEVLLRINPQFGNFFPNDETILEKIIQVCPRFYTELKIEWQRTESIALAAIKYNANYLKEAGNSLLNDEDFLLKAISNNIQTIKHVPIHLRNKAHFMAQACQIHEECFKYVGSELEQNRLFLQNISPFIQSPEIKRKFDKKRGRAQ